MEAEAAVAYRAVCMKMATGSKHGTVTMSITSLHRIRSTKVT